MRTGGARRRSRRETKRSLEIPVVKQTIDRINWAVGFTPKFRADMGAMADFLKQKIDWDKAFATRPLKKADPALVS